MGQGLTAIQKQETNIASQLSNEWAERQTLNQESVMLTPNNIKSAAQLINLTRNNLKIDLNNVVELVMKQANDIIATKKSNQAQQIANQKRRQAQQNQPTPTAQTMTVGRGEKPGDPNDPAMAQLLATAKRQGKI
jgi:predicted HNH restriction endonuclease